VTAKFLGTQGVLRLRGEVEAEEGLLLAPYAVQSAKSRGRRHPEAEDIYRTVFQRDRDRVSHTTAFRRMGLKTQVFDATERDHFRNRLTHTLEISPLARGIARTLRLNEDLAEAVVLAHDLGHTPFGHSGEEQMNALMTDEGGFDHTLHSLRVVDHLERRHPGFRGLNLTFEVREGLAKKHSDKAAADPRRGAEFCLPGYPTLEAQVADAADEISYCAHDVDDGLRSGILSPATLSGVSLWEDALRAARKTYGEPGEILPRAVSRIVTLMAYDLVLHTASVISAAGVAHPDDVRAYPAYLVSYSPEMAAKKKALKEFLMRNVYLSPQVQEAREVTKRVLADLFHAFALDPGLLPPRFRERVPEEGARRIACDYVAGMTDRFAVEEHERLFGEKPA